MGTVIKQAVYQVDVFGNQIEADFTVSGTTTVNKYTFNGKQVWGDLNNSNSLTFRRVYTDAVDGVFTGWNGSGNIGWYLTDHLGSVRDIEGSGQTVIDHLNFDAYGNLTQETVPSVGDRFKYDGGALDAVTGLYHFDHRDYNPVNGRWLTQDPIAFDAGDGNLYRYVGNAPTDGVDPSGLDATEIGRASCRERVCVPG